MTREEFEKAVSDLPHLAIKQVTFDVYTTSTGRGWLRLRRHPPFQPTDKISWHDQSDLGQLYARLVAEEES